jgi:hypothetical protein
LNFVFVLSLAEPPVCGALAADFGFAPDFDLQRISNDPTSVSLNSRRRASFSRFTQSEPKFF